MAAAARLSPLQRRLSSSRLRCVRRLNGLELLLPVCATAAGFAWLDAAGVPSALCAEAAAPLGADPLADLQRSFVESALPPCARTAPHPPPWTV